MINTKPELILFVGNKIFALRTASHLSRQELANELQKHNHRIKTDPYAFQKLIDHWENGRRCPEIGDVIALCEYFSVSPNYFFDLEGNDSPAPDVIAAIFQKGYKKGLCKARDLITHMIGGIDFEQDISR